MRSLHAALISLVAAAALVLAAGSWAALGSGAQHLEGAKFCGDTVKEGAGAYDVEANGIGCTKARRVAKAYVNQLREILRFKCKETRIGDELFRARCKRVEPAAVVKFTFGA